MEEYKRQKKGYNIISKPDSTFISKNGEKIIKDNEKMNKINDLEYLDWIFNQGWQRVKKGGFG